jgi:glycosyltransferase involved in cell wall biosynthesis
LKVCFVLENFYPYIGGAETLFREYTARLAESGCEIKVLTSNSGGVNGTVSYDGVEVHHFPWRGFFSHPVPRVKDLRAFIEWSDLVHTATLTAAPVALSVAKEFNKPCLITVFEVWANKWFWIEKNFLKATLYYLFERYILTRNYTFYHAISASTQNDLIKSGVDSRLIAAIYPGVKTKSSGPNGRQVSRDEPPPAESEERNQTFLYFGRPGKPKGIFVLLDAIKAIRNQLPAGFRFTYIVSNKPLGEKNRLCSLVNKYALEDVITIKDPLAEEDLVRAIQEAYCVIVPSITEGFGLSAAEACMLGKPVIVSDAGSLPEVVFGKVLFFQNRNSSDLATKILLATEGKFEFLPERKFDWNISTSRLLDVYQDLTKNHGIG